MREIYGQFVETLQVTPCGISWTTIKWFFYSTLPDTNLTVRKWLLCLDIGIAPQSIYIYVSSQTSSLSHKCVSALPSGCFSIWLSGTSRWGEYYNLGWESFRQFDTEQLCYLNHVVNDSLRTKNIYCKRNSIMTVLEYVKCSTCVCIPNMEHNKSNCCIYLSLFGIHGINQSGDISTLTFQMLVVSPSGR